MIDFNTSPITDHTTKTGIPVRNLWHMLLYTWNALHFIGKWKVDIENAPTLDALMATILGNLVQQRLRIGLGRNYRTHQSEIAGVRGRICFNESLKRISFQRGRATCQFQDFSADVPKNQIIRSSMARLVQIGNFGSAAVSAGNLRSRLRRLIRDMDQASLVELTAEFIRREQLKRHDPDYSLMLAICRLIHQRQMPTETAGDNSLLGLDRDAYTLHDIYEKFVAKFYAFHLDGWFISPQQKLTWPADSDAEYLPSMYPDVTMKHKSSGRLVVLDTKFTAKLLVAGRWGKLTFNRDHLFQIYSYLRSQEHLSVHHQNATGILLYPSVSQEISESASIQGHFIRWETIDLAKPWELIEEKLISIPTSILV